MEYSGLTAAFLKFDVRKGATWHCIVGRNFGSFVTHGMEVFLLTPLVGFHSPPFMPTGETTGGPPYA